ncbi:hypothetical protein ZWY2020_019233 [Hordeum vulgare]|nr:hypothetical protein ZWY2020_019233 [Hordeum vulgare]
MERPMAMMTTKIYCRGFGPEPYEDTARRRMKLAEALGFGAELQEVILTWHVFTDVFLLFSRGIPKDKDATSSTYVKAIKALSDYMVFLVAIIHDTIPGLELHSLYKATHRALEVELRFSCEQHVEEQLASIMQNRTHVSLGGASIILSHGFFMLLLLELLDAGNPDKLGVISTYEDTDDAAMDKLKRLIPDLEPSCRGGVSGMPEALALILMPGCACSSSCLPDVAGTSMPDRSAMVARSEPSSGSWKNTLACSSSDLKQAARKLLPSDQCPVIPLFIPLLRFML